MEGSPLRRENSAAAMGHAEDFAFDRESRTAVPDAQAEKILDIDRQIAERQNRIREGRGFMARMKNPDMIAIAEKTEIEIETEIARLEEEKAKLQGTVQ